MLVVLSCPPEVFETCSWLQSCRTGEPSLFMESRLSDRMQNGTIARAPTFLAYRDPGRPAVSHARKSSCRESHLGGLEGGLEVMRPCIPCPIPFIPQPMPIIPPVPIILLQP